MLKVAIDAGHGKNTPGKRVPSDLWVPAHLRDTREWVLNDRVARRLMDKLKPYYVSCIRTDDPTGRMDPALATRRTRANKAGANLFLSIHHNAGLNGRSGGGVTVYYHTNDAHSSYITANATHLYNAIVLRCGNKGNRSMPIGSQTLGVLSAANNAHLKLLVECGFMDGPDDVERICSPEYADQVAQGIAEYIIGAWRLKPKEYIDKE